MQSDAFEGVDAEVYEHASTSFAAGAPRSFKSTPQTACASFGNESSAAKGSSLLCVTVHDVFQTPPPTSMLQVPPEVQSLLCRHGRLASFEQKFFRTDPLQFSGRESLQVKRRTACS